MFRSFKAGLRLAGIVTLAACLVPIGTADVLARGGGHGGGGFGGGGFGGGHFGGGGFGGGGGFRGGDFGGGFGDRGDIGSAWHDDGFHPARDDPAGFDHARVVNHYYHNGCRNCRWANNDDDDDDDFNYDYEDGSPFWGLPPDCTYVSGVADQNCGPYGYHAAYGNNGMYYTRN